MQLHYSGGGVNETTLLVLHTIKLDYILMHMYQRYDADGRKQIQVQILADRRGLTPADK